MLVGHRWKYNYSLRWYECEILPIGGVESHQWCVGCGVKVTDKELCESGFPKPKQYNDGYAEGVYLDILARGKGKEPIETGTFAAYKLKRR